MKIQMLMVSMLSSFVYCNTTPSPNTVANDVEAGAQIIQDTCTIIMGLDPSGVVKTVCATAQEIAQVSQWILTLRKASPQRPGGICQVLKGSTACLTAAERAQAVDWIVSQRAKMYLLDASAK